CGHCRAWPARSERISSVHSLDHCLLVVSSSHEPSMAAMMETTTSSSVKPSCSTHLAYSLPRSVKNIGGSSLLIHSFRPNSFMRRIAWSGAERSCQGEVTEDVDGQTVNSTSSSLQRCINAASVTTA